MKANTHFITGEEHCQNSVLRKKIKMMIYSIRDSN